MKLHKVFTAGKYPQGDITESDLQEIANNYDPGYHEAPLTLNHQKEGSALGWINKVVAKGKDLFVEFKNVSDKAKELVINGEYKRPSIEIADYENKGKYLRAVSLVLFPAVKGLPEMQFKTEDNEATIYSSEETEIIFNKNKPTKNMADKLIKFKERMSLALEASEEDVIKAYDEKLTEKEAEINAIKTEAGTLQAKIKEFKEQEIDNLVVSALKDGKIVEAQKESIKSFAVSNFDGCKKYLDSLPVNAMYKNDQAKDKSFHSDGLTYEEILKNPALSKKFSEEELLELRKAHSVFGG